MVFFIFWAERNSEPLLDLVPKRNMNWLNARSGSCTKSDIFQTSGREVHDIGIPRTGGLVNRELIMAVFRNSLGIVQQMDFSQVAS